MIYSNNLISRRMKVQRLAEYARKEHNLIKLRQAEIIINQIDERLLSKNLRVIN